MTHPAAMRTNARDGRDKGKSVHHTNKGTRIDDRADEIETFTIALRPFTLQFPHDKQTGDNPDRHVDKEDTPPAKILRQYTP